MKVCCRFCPAFRAHVQSYKKSEGTSYYSAFRGAWYVVAPAPAPRPASGSRYHVCATSHYSFIPNLLKLCTRFWHGLKMCMWFGYSPEINFCYFFRVLNLATFLAWILSKSKVSGYLVCTTPHTVLCWPFWNFASYFVMVCRCACGLDIILISFFTYFFWVWNLTIFRA